ncbi:DUF2927 domain-containing protein [Pontibacillus marinus]|uniref:SbsA Ig-like domain-containing protein n=1 Tax=Pontibacillus marinus BH030004 = DSM 16465 TaxID=1385511 RepID=A0A0A5I351_9BACI|nr:DUF2927 domain-containing protein [Pontibacillus marinus]KGX90267.1 hypothetical protein N783_20985 [Pontibacillus marinus BH030004 = DSM 16465]
MKWIRSLIVILLSMTVIVIYQSLTYADELETVSTYKSWKITFNTPISPDYINSDSIYVMNEETGKRVSSVQLNLSQDQKVVTIQPTVPYNPTTTFTLHIKQPIISTKGMPMMEGEQKQFKTKGKPKYSEQAMEYFQEIAFGSEWGDADYPVRKWNNNPRIKVFGNPSDKDMNALQNTISEVNGLQDHIELKLVDSDPNIKIYFVPLEDFGEYVDNPKAGNWGLFYYWWEPGEFVIDEAEILISTDKPTPKGRSHLIREELTQSLGLPRDSYSYPKSMFFQDYTTVTAYTELDKTLIQMLYEDEIKAGMTQVEAIEVFHNLLP